MKRIYDGSEYGDNVYQVLVKDAGGNREYLCIAGDNATAAKVLFRSLPEYRHLSIVRVSFLRSHRTL